MDHAQIQQAAAALAEARRTMVPLAGLPAGSSPATITDAHAIQDATTALLGWDVAGWKASVPPGGEPSRGVIYPGGVAASPADIPAAVVPQCGVEGEVAFVFRHPLPPREMSYTREEVAAAVEALPAIEIVHSRFPLDAAITGLDKLADSTSNGGLVVGAARPDWQALDLGHLHVTLSVNGEAVLSQTGGHPTGDPLGTAVALVNLMRETTGVRPGQYVTCGSCTGLRYLEPGDTCAVTFEGLGSASVTFAAADTAGL